VVERRASCRAEAEAAQLLAPEPQVDAAAASAAHLRELEGVTVCAEASERQLRIYGVESGLHGDAASLH
jgi:hypothetical protein